MDQNGVPTVTVSTVSEFSGKAAELAQTSNPAVSFSAMVRAILDMATTAVKLALDPWGRKLVAQSGEGSTLDESFDNTTAPNQLHFVPEDGQESRTLTWSDPTTEGTIPAELSTALGALVSPVRPAMSADSLLAKLANALPETYQDRCVFFLNQATAKVSVLVFASASARSTFVAASFPSASSEGIVAVEFAGDPIPGGGETLLPFEGGLISVP